MRNFGTLYGFELKKLLGRKLVWVTVLGMVGMLLFGNLASAVTMTVQVGNQSLDGFAYYRLRREASSVLNGRVLDDALLAETQAAWSDFSVENTMEQWVLRRRYQQVANAVMTVCSMAGDSDLFDTIRAEDFYALRRSVILAQGEEDGLTQAELDRLQARLDAEQTPLRVQDCGGWEKMLVQVYTLAFLTVLLTAICLSGVFSDEHLRRTDQLILSSPLGRRKLYGAKLLAGLTVDLAGLVLMTAASLLSAALLYGLDGLDAPVQLIAIGYAGTLTVGQAVGIFALLLLLAAVVCGLLAMVLGELLRSNIASMATLTVVAICSMVVEMPSIRPLSMAYDLLPTRLLYWYSSVTDYRLFSLLGLRLTNLQMAALVYILGSAILALGGSRLYRRYQVSGR